jgi:hypothetical protein
MAQTTLMGDKIERNKESLKKPYTAKLKILQTGFD